MALTAERYRRAVEAFLAARERPAAERAALLAEACGGDDELRREAQALLAADVDTAADFLEPEPRRPAPPPDLGADRGYRVVGELGRGGSGTVFLAERVDGAFERRVALKLLDRVVAPVEARRRFDRERRILAGLDHPCIARLLDGGAAPDGSPYLVMEHVAGERIDVYCRRRGLGLEATLRLFLRVCDALAYAHRRLVVHRDLKPANILVDAEGTPKLLDFGIAKLLAAEPGDEHTLEGVQPLTPRYASPEQVRGETVTTASDVYSLGVVLYELLAGASPYGSALERTEALSRSICEVEPPPPSAAAAAAGAGEAAARARLARALHGDLDAIGLQALRKSPSERYASVDHLADDLRRYLDGQPVAARRGNRLYRARKLLRRHWLAFGTAAAVAATVLAFVVGLRAQLGRVQAERDRAERLSGLLVDLFKGSDPLAGESKRPDVRELLQRGARRVAADPQLDAATRAALLQAVGQVYLNLGDLLAAEPVLSQALALRRGHTPDIELATSLHDLAALRQQLGDLKGAEALAREALELRQRLGGSTDVELANLWNSLAVLGAMQGRHAEADSAFERAIELRRRHLPQEEAEYAHLLKNYATGLVVRGRRQQAEPLLREAIGIQRRLYPQGHANLARSLGTLALLRSAQGSFDEAEALYREALEMARATFGPRHRDTATLLNNYGLVPYSRGRLAEAEALFRDALAIDGPVLPADHPSVLTEKLNLGRLLADRRALAEARGLLSGVYQARRKALAAGHQDLGRAQANYGRVLCLQGEAEGLELLGAGIAALRAAGENVEPWILAQAETWRATCLRRGGRDAEAEALLDRALPVLEARLGRDSHIVREALAAR